MADGGQLSPELVDQLNQALNSATSGPAGGSEGSLFGMTLTAFLLTSVFGLLGLAYLVYAKRQGRLIIGLCGVGLMIFPLLVTNTVAMAACGTVLVFLPAVLKRVGIDL